MGQSGSKPVIL